MVQMNVQTVEMKQKNFNNFLIYKPCVIFQNDSF